MTATRTVGDRILELRARRASDLGWCDDESIAKGWPQRAQLAAGIIKPGSRVIDLGCGNQLLRRFLPPDVQYTPADLVPRTSDTVLIELNTGLWPKGRWDTAYALGVLEYIYDVREFFRGVAQLAPRLVITYHVSVDGSKETMDFRVSHSGWLSDFTLGQILDAANSTGWMALKVSAFQRKQFAWQYIFAFEHQSFHQAA